MGQHDEEAGQDAQKIYPGDVTASGIQWLVGTHGGGGISAARHRRRRSETIPVSPAYSIIKWKKLNPLPAFLRFTSSFASKSYCSHIKGTSSGLIA